MLRSYTAAAKERAREQYRFDVLKFVIERSYAAKRMEPPPMPGILKEIPRHD